MNGMEIVFLVWFAACVVIGMVAAERGRSGFTWGAIAFFMSPLLGYLALIAIPMRGHALDRFDGAQHTRCPLCNGPSFATAARCFTCGGNLTTSTADKAAAPRDA